MANARRVAVVDIGKSNAKLALVDLAERREIAAKRRPNDVVDAEPYPHFDVEGIFEFLCDALAEFGKEPGFDAISVTTHGASAALLDGNRDLALPVLDYEFEGPDAVDAQYAQIRPAFAESLTPPLPIGLNLGKQIFWQAHHFPRAFARVRHILTYPQYWSYRLSGVMANEITSIGCHTDLWDFTHQRYSSLVEGQGWRDLMAPLRKAGDCLGTLDPDLTKRLGLAEAVPVYCGIHDSNASLLPYVLSEEAPFAVISTGTWVVVCAPGGDLDRLDPDRDSYANIDALGRPVPSARFMGGREFEVLTGGGPTEVSEDAVRRVLAERALILPSVTKGSGPFPHADTHAIETRERLGEAGWHAAVSFYLALMSNVCLDLAGARGPIHVEGPFAANRLYLQMLRAATGRPVYAQTSGTTGTAIGAALLAGGEDAAPTRDKSAEIQPFAEAEMRAYAQSWQAAVADR